MRFIVDAQLPPALAVWLRSRGHAADHVRDLGLAVQADEKIVELAVAVNAIIITKDSDFAHLSSVTPGCKVV